MLTDMDRFKTLPPHTIFPQIPRLLVGIVIISNKENTGIFSKEIKKCYNYCPFFSSKFLLAARPGQVF